MKPDGSGVADCMKMKEVSVMNVEKKKKKPPPRWKEAHPDNRTKLQLVWARLCLVGNLSSTPRPALPRPLPPSRCEIQTSPGWLCVAAKVSLCSAV